MCIKVSCFRRVQNEEIKRFIRRYHFKLKTRLLLFYLNDWLLETGDEVSLVIRFRVDFNIDAVPGVLLSDDVELFGEACWWFWCCCCWGSDPFLGEVIFGLANCATRCAGLGLISGLGSRLVIGLNLPEKWPKNLITLLCYGGKAVFLDVSSVRNHLHLNTSTRQALFL